MGEIQIKFYLYQILGVGIVWLGMLYFFDDLYDQGKVIFYVVTSWLLFIIVLAGKKFFHDRQERDEE